MIEAKQAVSIAQRWATEMLEWQAPKLEEIERESHNERDVWGITLSFPRDASNDSPLARLAAPAFEYKRFLIDVQTGEMVAMRRREFASR